MISLIIFCPMPFLSHFSHLLTSLKHKGSGLIRSYALQILIILYNAL